jgi:hypothetical protein
VPWSPFGPGDTASPDTADIVSRATKTMEGLRAAQVTLTGMRHGPGPDGTPPVVEEVSRADGLWPYLLIRTYPGDVGKRPIGLGEEPPGYFGWVSSPDVIVTNAGPAGEPRIVGRGAIDALKAREVGMLTPGFPYDVWVHVWNLGQLQATGVRVRVRLRPTNEFWPNDWPEPAERFLGGTTLDLGDRLSETAHLVIKAATFTPDDLDSYYLALIVATAECPSDVASGDLSRGADRHSAHRLMTSVP